MLNHHLHHLHHSQSVAQNVPDRLQAQRALQWLSRLLTTSPTGRSGWIVFCLLASPYFFLHCGLMVSSPYLLITILEPSWSSVTRLGARSLNLDQWWTKPSRSWVDMVITHVGCYGYFSYWFLWLFLIMMMLLLMRF